MYTQFEVFCDKFHINSSKHNQAQLNHIANICFKEISQDMHFETTHDQDHVFDNYLNYIKCYCNEFLSKTTTEATHTTWNPIQFASYHGYDRYIEGLNKPTSIDLNQADAYGMRPLHLAATAGHMHTVQALLAQGADATLMNKQLQNPAYCSLSLPMSDCVGLQAKKDGIFRILWEKTGIGVFHPDFVGDTVVHLMCVYGYERLLGDVLDFHPEAMFVANKQVEYPIHTALLNYQDSIVQLLLHRSKASASLKDAYQRMALHYAARYGTQGIIRACYQANPSALDQVDSDGYTPLMSAELANNQEAILVLQSLNT